MPPRPLARASRGAGARLGLGGARLALGVVRLALGVALAVSLACARTPRETPDPKPRREVLTTRWDDARVGREGAAEVSAEIGVIEDPELAAWVSGIGRRLLRGVPRSGFDYQFLVVDLVEPNAFALPGGFVFVSRGLLVLANSEDEVACVLGHEIVHAARRHAAAQQALARSIGPIALPWVRAAQMASYSREMEREADQWGQQLCAAAGYDPLGLASFMRSLEQLEQLRRGVSRGTSFFDTHPGSRERAAANAVRASEIRWRRDPAAGDPRAALLAHIEGLATGQRPEAGVFVGDDFLHPVLGLTLRFPNGWTQVNSNRAVGAVAPRGEAVVFLEANEAVADPRAMAEAWVAKMREETPLDLVESRPVKVGAIDAWRVRLAAGSGGASVSGYVTFVPMDDSGWRVTGLARAARASSLLGPTLRSARSLRPMDAQDAERIRVTRLKLVKARAGEDLEALGRRTGNRWDLQTTAVYNAVFANHRFGGGESVKITLEEPYRPR